MNNIIFIQLKSLNHSKKLQSLEIMREDLKEKKNRYKVSLKIQADDEVKYYYLGYFDPGFFQAQCSEIMPDSFMNFFEKEFHKQWNESSKNLKYDEISLENKANYAQWHVNQQMNKALEEFNKELDLEK